MTSYIDTMTKQFYDRANILDKVILIRKIKKKTLDLEQILITRVYFNREENIHQ